MAGDQAHVIEARVGKRTLKKQKKVLREKTEGLGAAWFGMKAPEVTEEVQRDLEVLKMRGAIDPKRFYKKTGIEGDGLQKYFQVCFRDHFGPPEIFQVWTHLHSTL